MLTITCNPENDVYRGLIDYAFKACDEFILVVHKNYCLKYSKTKNLILERLNPFLKEMKEQLKWAGTEMRGTGAFVYHYNTDQKANKIIKEVSNSLYDWMYPDLPEDLCFYKNGKPWLIDIAHENYSYILTEDETEINEILSIKGLKIKT